MADLEWLKCNDGVHMHYWRDTFFEKDFLIPETFMDKIKKDLAEPLVLAEAAIDAAMDSLEPDSIAWIILNAYQESKNAQSV